MIKIGVVGIALSSLFSAIIIGMQYKAIKKIDQA